MSPSVEPFSEVRYKALMDGLECSEVLQSSLERTLRIDAEFYQKESFDVLSLIHKMQHYPLTKYVDVSDGNHMSISNSFVSNGIPYYRGQYLKSYFIENNSPICIDEKSFNQPYMWRSHLKKGDVLLSIVGTIGSLATVSSSAQATCSCKLAILRPKKIADSDVIALFLRCKYGQNQIKKFTRGAVQMGLILEDMEQIVIPEFQDEFKDNLKNIVATAFDQENIAKTIYSEAEHLLISTLCIGDFTSLKQAVSLKKFSESFATSGRLDAEYYQAKYDELFASLRKQITHPLSGKDGITTIQKSIEPGSDAYCDEGIPFVRVSDVTKYKIRNPEIKLSRDIVPDATTLFPCKDTILFSKDGSVGIAYKVERDMKVITSGALLHLMVKNPDEVLPDYLTLVLNSKVVQLQAERDSSGAIIQHWKPSEIEKVLIPVLDIVTQKQISSKVQESFVLRQRSEELLEYAKRAVEVAIEEGEEKAMEWLKEKGVEC